MTSTLEIVVCACIAIGTAVPSPVPATPEIGFPGVYANNEGAVDPDLEWAEIVGPETRERVGAAVDAYLIDPDLAPPACWEDEAVVVIVDYVTPDGPYVVPEMVGTLGCVPLDNLPVTGYRPEP